MAYKLINKDWSPCLNDYKHDYIVDAESDIASLPKCATSSSALVIATGNIYMVNTAGNWVEFAAEEA